MAHNSFGEFIDKKQRDAIRQLELLEKVLVKGGLKVERFLENDSKDPHIFCYNPLKNGSFDGIRIYRIGNKIAFRIQKESKTHPYGRAYQLDVEEMFNDIISDEKVDEKQAGVRVIESVNKEVRKFFERSADAEKDSRDDDVDDSMGNIALRSQATDYAAMVHSKV